MFSLAELPSTRHRASDPCRAQGRDQIEEIAQVAIPSCKPPYAATVEQENRPPVRENVNQQSTARARHHDATKPPRQTMAAPLTDLKPRRTAP